MTDAARVSPPRSERLAAARTWATALAFGLVAWGSLLGAGLGGGAGVSTHAVAAKPAGGSLHLQRQAGAPSVTRSARRDQVQRHAQPQPAAELRATAADSGGGDLAPQGFALQVAAGRAEAPDSAAAEPTPRTRHRAPLSRAPPARA